MTVDTNLAILIGIGICAAAHVLVTLIERVTARRSAMDDGAAASVWLKRIVDQYPPGTDLAVTVGNVTLEAQTPDPTDEDDGDAWKHRA